MGAEGFLLKIDKTLVDNLQKADIAITNLDKDTTLAYNNMKSAFDKINALNLDGFIKTLVEAKARMGEMSNFTVNVSGNMGTFNIRGLDESKDKMVSLKETVTSLVNSLQQIKGGNNNTIFSSLDSSIKTVVKDITKEVKTLDKAYTKLDDSIRKYYDNSGKLATKLNELREAQRKMNEEMKRVASGNVNSLLSPNIKPNTLNELKQYSKELKSTMANLDPKSEDWARLNRQLQQTNTEIRGVEDKMRGVRREHRSLMDISGQLARKLALVFSVSQVQGYISQLVKIRAEFELNQRALQAMLQNKQAADEIWNKTVALAVRSPFRVRELVSYTKQLAAYRIEADKLYETNKMLADISAGLGVDMQRLILAYGQVRSAAYLRGTEVRQFTEAGIPILNELSKYFEELEGQAVSVGEVFERISKRMVTFGDVAEIFKRLTSEGGTFYRMQEIQAETLKGTLTNLKDSWDLALNEMGKRSEHTIKNLLKLFKGLADNWEIMYRAIQMSGVVLGGLGVRALLASKAIRQLAIDYGYCSASATGLLSVSTLLRTLFTHLTVSVKTFGTALKTFIVSNPVIAALAAIGTALTVLVTKYRENQRAVEDISKAYAELRRNIEDVSVSFSNAMKKSDEDEMRNKLKQLIRLAETDYNIKLSIDVKELDKDELEDKFVEIRQLITDTNAFAEDFAIKFQEDSKWQFLGNAIGKDFEQLGSIVGKVSNQLINDTNGIVFRFEEMRRNGKEFTEEQKKALEIMSEPQRVDESQLDYVDRLRNAYVLLTREYNDLKKKMQDRATPVVDSKTSEYFRNTEKMLKDLGVDIEGLPYKFYRWENAEKEALKEFKDFASQLNLDESIPMDKKVIMLRTAIDRMKSEKNWSEFEVNYIQRWSDKELNIKVNYVLDTNTAPSLSQWQQNYKEMFEGFEGYFRNLTVETTRADIIESLQDKLKNVEQTIARIRNAGGTSGAYAGEKLDNLLKQQKDLTTQLNWFGIAESSTTKKTEDVMSSRISLIKELNARYLELGKTFDKISSKESVIESFQRAWVETFGGTKMKIEDIDFTTAGGVADALMGLRELAKNESSKARQILEKEIGEFLVKIGIDEKQLKDESLKKEVQDIFDQFDLSLELDKLDIPKDLAKSLFDVDMIDVKELRSIIEGMRSEFIGSDMEDEYKKYLDKIDEMENKASIERMKTYSKYLKMSMNDRVKMEVETLKKIKEVNESEEFNESQKSRIIDEIRKEAKKESDKMDWEDFKGSELYTMMFEDIEYLGTKSINVLKDRLVELKDKLQDLPVQDVKEIVGQIEKLENQAMANNPFKSLVNSMKEIRQLQSEGKTEDVLQEELMLSEEKISSYERELDAISVILSARERGIDLNVEDNELIKGYEHLVSLSNEQLTMRQGVMKGNLDLQKSANKEAKEGLDVYADARKSLDASKDAWESIKNLTKRAYDAIKDVVESLGGEADGITLSLAEASLNIVDMVIQSILFTKQLTILRAQAKELGIEMNNMLGVIGWIVTGIEVIASTISAIVGAKDKALAEKVDKQRRNVERLQKAYDNLKESFDEAFSIEGLKEYNDEMRRNINLQIEAQKAAIAAQEKRKKANKEGSDEWKELQSMYDELDEMTKAQGDRLKETISEVTDGVLDSVTSAAQEFTDAWWDAFQETGDGLSGLKENFNDLMASILKKQATLQITGMFVDKWKKQLGAFLNEDDLELTKDEAKMFMEQVRETLPQLSEALENYLGSFAETMKAGGEGSLSELAKGISSASEESIEILTAYANSIRFINQDSNEKLSRLVDSYLSVTELNNSMLDEMRNQTRVLKDFYNLVNDLTAAHPTESGLGLKVIV